MRSCSAVSDASSQRRPQSCTGRKGPSAENEQRRYHPNCEHGHDAHATRPSSPQIARPCAGSASSNGESEISTACSSGRSSRDQPASRVGGNVRPCRSEEHTSELQSLMRISYAVFCLKKKKINNTYNTIYTTERQITS